MQGTDGGSSHYGDFRETSKANASATASIVKGPGIYHKNLAPSVPWVHHGEMDERDQAQLRQQVRELKLRHHDLDCAIRALAERSVVDQLQLARLKKEKLSLKDRIARLQSRLIPDLNA